MFKDTIALISRIRNKSPASETESTEKIEVVVPFVAIMAHLPAIRGQGYNPNEKKVRESYKTIMSMVVGLGNNDRAVELVDTVEWTSRKKHRHLNFLFALTAQLEGELSPHFLFTLDWKAGVDDLHWHIDKALSDTDFNPNLPDPDKYPSNASIQYGLTEFPPKSATSSVFEDYIRALNEVGLSLAFMETLSDYFLLFVFEVKNRDVLGEAILQTGSGPGFGFMS